MDGLEQVKAYSRLGGDDFKAGDLVDVRQLGSFEVLAVLPDGLLNTSGCALPGVGSRGQRHLTVFSAPQNV